MATPARSQLPALSSPPGIIDDDQLEQRILERCRAVKEHGDLVDAKALAQQLKQRHHQPMPVVPARHVRLEGPDLHDLLLPSVRIVGHYYLCAECAEWHFTGASGFCVDTAGSVATCAHVVAPDDGMREAYLVVADLHGEVWPVLEVTAGDVDADVCVLHTAAKDTVPLPMREDARVGEKVYCLSNPDHQVGFFSDGIVARWYAAPPEAEVTADAAGPAVASPPRPALPWLHVTCDFAKGSSGAPVVDAMGNVLGVAQSTTTVIYDDQAAVVDTQMVFKTATPAAALLALRRPLPPDAKGETRR